MCFSNCHKQMSSLTSFFPNISTNNNCITFAGSLSWNVIVFIKILFWIEKMISWLNNGLLIIKVFTGLLLRLQQVSSNNFWTTYASFLHEFGSDNSALYMALVRVLIVLYAGDVIVVLPAFFHSWYRFCYSLSFSQTESRFSCLFNLRHLDSFSLYLSLPIHPFDFAK